MKKRAAQIGANYFIFLLCSILYLTTGAVSFLFLPLVQLFLCYENYKCSHNLKYFLVLQINMLTATISGNFTGAQLFFTYISNDAESQMIFALIFRFEIWIVLALSAIFGAAKLISVKRGK